MLVDGDPDLEATNMGECALECEGVDGLECAGVITLLE